ncbi:hypothetical protein ACFL0V_02495 [Nanoarchaeota archaeon]
MVTRKLLADELALEYEGLFDAAELYALIDDWTKLKGYDKFETLNQEIVVAEGKEIRIILEPRKWHTDYIRKYLKFELVMREVKEVETVVDKMKVKMNQGKIRLLFSGYLETDWEGRWEQKPIYHFMRTLFDKYVYRSHTNDFEREILSDVQDIMSQVGSFLNLYRYRKVL